MLNPSGSLPSNRMEDLGIGILEAYTYWPIPEESFVYSLSNGAYFIITNKYDLSNENDKINQDKNENGY